MCVVFFSFCLWFGHFIRLFRSRFLFFAVNVHSLCLSTWSFLWYDSLLISLLSEKKDLIEFFFYDFLLADTIFSRLFGVCTLGNERRLIRFQSSNNSSKKNHTEHDQKWREREREIDRGREKNTLCLMTIAKLRVTETRSGGDVRQKKLLTDLGQIIRSRITRAQHSYVLMRDLSHKNGRTRWILNKLVCSLANVPNAYASSV